MFCVSSHFGKSLLISTLEAYSLGKKDLFEGLAIDALEKDWIEYPVLHLELSAFLDSCESVYGNGKPGCSLSVRFEDVIRRLDGWVVA